MLRRMIVMLIFLGIPAAISPLVTLACQGPAPYDFANIARMDLWVRATVMEVDSRGFSAILRVHEYYKGEGPALLAVVRFPVGLETARRVRGYGTRPCLYAGYGTRLQRERQGYFGLSSNGDGTYTDLLYNAAHYFFVDGEMDGDYYVDDPDGYMEQIVLTEAEFTARLLEVGQREEPVAPESVAVERYPLMRYLQVTLENGDRYHVNPDRSVSELPEDSPIAISPDGAHTIHRGDNGMLFFNYIWGKQYMPQDFRDEFSKPGKAAVFSPDSNMVAVWDDKNLAIYVYHNGGERSEDHWWARFAIEQVGTAGILLDANTNFLIAWSPDSSTIAWQDLSGIWRWNLYQDSTPNLIPDAGQGEAYRFSDISRSGRYVSYRSDAETYLYDSRSETSYVNAISAPNESFILVNEPNRDKRMEWRREACQAPMNENCAVMRSLLGGGVSVFPYQMELLGKVYCEGGARCDVYGISWHPSTTLASAGYSGGRVIDIVWEDARQVAYDPFYDQPAVLRGEYQIEFDFYHSGYFTGALEGVDLTRLDYVNLEGIVDSPIAAIEWGQPIFYDSFMLTATEYLPRTVTIAGGAAPSGAASEA